MQFTKEVTRTLLGFVVAGTSLPGTSLTYVLVTAIAALWAAAWLFRRAGCQFVG